MLLFLLLQVADIVRGLQMLCLVFAFPLSMLPVRSIVSKLFSGCKKSSTTKASTEAAAGLLHGDPEAGRQERCVADM